MKHVDEAITPGKIDALTSPDAGETVASAHVPHNAPAAPAVAHAKVCCACGVNVANERRYKDSQGRYWCCDCAKADAEHKHQPAATTPCPDCQQTFAAADLVEHDGVRTCSACHDKRIKQAKRAAARLAAAAEEAAAQKARRKNVVVAGCVFVALALAFAVYRLFLR